MAKPKGLGGLDLGKQLAEVQARMVEAQKDLGQHTVSATAGGGAVKITMTGDQKVVSVEIAKEAAEDWELLQEMVLVAVNEATKQAQALAARKVGEITGGLGLPFGSGAE
ncbi:MAG: YbaB/EbfC family nucleoid-associated protein [Anaerolineae bacterium]